MEKRTVYINPIWKVTVAPGRGSLRRTYETEIVSARTYDEAAQVALAEMASVTDRDHPWGNNPLDYYVVSVKLLYEFVSAFPDMPIVDIED
jgi:hypothetical protein